MKRRPPWLWNRSFTLVDNLEPFIRFQSPTLRIVSILFDGCLFSNQQVLHYWAPSSWWWLWPMWHHWFMFQSESAHTRSCHHSFCQMSGFVKRNRQSFLDILVPKFGDKVYMLIHLVMQLFEFLFWSTVILPYLCEYSYCPRGTVQVVNLASIHL